MEDRDKDKEQLQNELTKLPKKIAQLKHVKASQKQTEEKLAKPEEMYRLIAENTSDAITLHKFNLKASFTYISPSGKDICGYELEELLGKSPFDFVHPDDKKKLFPILTDYINAKLKKFFIGKELPTTKRIEFRFKDKEGNWRYFQSTGNILGNQLLFITRDITDHKKTEEALNKSQQEFASLFKSNPEALVYLDEKGIILEANLRFCKLFGYILKEIKGRNIDDGMIHTSDKIKEGKKLSIKGLEGYLNYETIRKKKDGTLFPVSISATPLEIDGQVKGEIGIYIDITERKKAEEELRQSEEKFAGIFKNIPDAAFYQDTEGTILDINPRFTKVFGYTKEDALGKNIDEIGLYPKGKVKEGKDLTRKTLNEDLIDFETVRQKKDLTLVPVRISTSFVKIKNKVTGIICLYQDITKRKQSEKVQQVLYNISKAVNSPISLKQFYKAIHKELGTIIDTTNFYIALLDKDKDELYFPYYIDEKDENMPIVEFSTTNTLTTYVIKTGKSLLNSNKQYKEMVNQGILIPMGSTTDESIWLGVPLKIKDKVMGAMAVQSYTNPNLYSEKDVELMEFVSFQIATAIERKRMEEELKKLAHHDPLTGTYNRGYGLELLQRQVKIARRNKTSFLLAYTDLDNLKRINDKFGHKEGDKAIVQMVNLFQSTLREVDIIIRMGGDEFLLIFPESSPKDLSIINERFKENLIKLNQAIKKSYKIGFSIGISCYDTDNPRSAEELIRIADEKMYKEKKGKKL